MSATPIQLPCRKQGIFEQGNWSARVVTVDPAAGTIAISRKHKPNVLFHHAMEVRRVQMYPHFSRDHIVGNYHSLYKSQLALRIVGVEIHPSRMRKAEESNAAAIVQRHRSAFAPAAEAPAGGADISSSDADELPASPTRDTEPMIPSAASGQQAKGRQVFWMIRFESLLNFEAMVLALMSMKSPSGQPLKVFTSANVQGDFNRIKRNYEELHAAAAEGETKKAAAAGAAPKKTA